MPVPRCSPPRWRDGRPLVLDADAVTLLAQRPELRARLHGMCVLTPHGGEFARLFPDLAARLRPGGPSRRSRPRAGPPRRAGCIVLLKGADTVIADHDRTGAVNSAHGDRAAPWLATAGSGDVLAGLMAGLLARGMAPVRGGAMRGLAACRGGAAFRTGTDCRRPARGPAGGFQVAESVTFILAQIPPPEAGRRRRRRAWGAGSDFGRGHFDAIDIQNVLTVKDQIA